MTTKATSRRPCKHSYRMKVNLFLDIPVDLAHRLAKKRLRLAAVRVEGADWPRAIIYCDKCGAKP